MPLFTAPTTAEVKDDCGLTAEQIDRLYHDSDVDTEIAQKISEAVAVVSRRLRRAAAPFPWPFTDSQYAVAYPDYDSDQRTEQVADQQKVASLAAKKLAISYLYRRSGQLQKPYADKADQYAAEYERLMTGEPTDEEDNGLLGEIRWEASVQPGDTTPSEMEHPQSSSADVELYW